MHFSWKPGQNAVLNATCVGLSEYVRQINTWAHIQTMSSGQILWSRATLCIVIIIITIVIIIISSSISSSCSSNRNSSSSRSIIIIIIIHYFLKLASYDF